MSLLFGSFDAGKCQLLCGVLHCRIQRLGDVCAVKVFADSSRKVQVQIKERELEIIRKLQHPNIVRFLAMEEEVRVVYLFTVVVVGQ